MIGRGSGSVQREVPGGDGHSGDGSRALAGEHARETGAIRVAHDEHLFFVEAVIGAQPVEHRVEVGDVAIAESPGRFCHPG